MKGDDKMTWKDIEKQLEYGRRNIIYVSKIKGLSFDVYNYSSNSFVNTLFGKLDIWATRKIGGIPKIYKGNRMFEYHQFELPAELYETLKLNSIRLLFVKEDVKIIFQEELD